jgi:BlaI family penicillinase repressor
VWTTRVIMAWTTIVGNNAMNKTPKISDTEWEVMRVVWGKHPITAAEVIADLAANDPSWHPKTARTLLARLVQKKALGYQSQGRSYVYTPLVSESECVGAASESFVTRVFGGSLRPLLAHFVEHQKLTEQDLQDLQRLLEQHRDHENRKPRRNHGKA